LIEKLNLRQALLDVCKAYRLLYFFQRRIMDLAMELARELGQEFYVWLPAGDNESLNWLKSPFQLSAWKMLPILRRRLLVSTGGCRL